MPAVTNQSSMVNGSSSVLLANLSVETYELLENTRESSHGESLPLILTQVLAYAIVLVSAVSGNSLIICAYIRYRTSAGTRMLNDRLIVHLAVSDLLLPVFAVPERVVRILCHDLWVLPGGIGVLLCKLVNFTEAVSIVASLLCVDAIAVDRFRAVFYPLSPPVCDLSSRLLIAVIWFTALVYNAPLLYFSSLVPRDGGVACRANTHLWNTRLWHRFYLALASISLLIVLVAYTCVVTRIFRRRAWMRRLTSNSLHERVNYKVFKISLAIVLAFYLCYSCYWLQVTLCTLNEPPRLCANQTFRFMNVYLAIANCAVNPIVCLAFSSRFRGLVRRMVCRT